MIAQDRKPNATIHCVPNKALDTRCHELTISVIVVKSKRISVLEEICIFDTSSRLKRGICLLKKSF